MCNSLLEPIFTRTFASTTPLKLLLSKVTSELHVASSILVTACDQFSALVLLAAVVLSVDGHPLETLGLASLLSSFLLGHSSVSFVGFFSPFHLLRWHFSLGIVFLSIFPPSVISSRLMVINTKTLMIPKTITMAVCIQLLT